MPETDSPRLRLRSAVSLSVLGLAGVLVAFVQTLILFAALEAERNPALGGADAAFGLPTSVPALAFFAFITAIGVSRLASAGWARWFSTTIVAVTALGVLYFVAVLIAGYSPLSLVELLLGIGALTVAIRWLMTDTSHVVLPSWRERPVVLAGFLIIAGLAGWVAAFELTLDKVKVIVDPDAVLACNISLIVQCGVNLDSDQGSVFGFPNPIIGLGAFVAPFAVGVALLAGARFGRWYWLVFNVGVLGAIVFVGWLISQSIFFLGSLCPWCAVVWSVTIPMFWLVTLYNLKTGNIPAGTGLRRFAAGAYGYVPLITLLCYIVVLVLYQVRLDILNSL